MSKKAKHAKRVIVPDTMKANYEQLHFAPAVRDGKRLFCSGQTGNAADGSLAEDPATQFAQAWDNVRTVLEAGGSSLDDIIEITSYHVGFSQHIAAFMKAKDAVVSEPYPAWTAIGVSELAFGALAEIRVIARVTD